MKKLLTFVLVFMAVIIMMQVQAAPAWFLILEPDVEYQTVGENMDMHDVHQCKKGFGHTHPYAWRSIGNNRRDQFMVDDPYFTRDGRLCRDTEFMDNRGYIVVDKHCCTKRSGNRCYNWAKVATIPDKW